MLNNVEFKRKFSLNLYKSEKLMLSKMTFGNLPLKTNRGDIYPTVLENGSFSDTCIGGRYVFTPDKYSSTARLIGAYNPYSTYDVKIEKLPEGASAGIYVSFSGGLFVYGTREGERIKLELKLDGALRAEFGYADFAEGMHLIFTLHEGFIFDAYVKYEDRPISVGKAEIEECSPLISEDVFSNTDAALFVKGDKEIIISSVENYLDCGVMQADIKPIKNESGEVIVEEGKIFLTYTARFEAKMMQQIASYKLSSCEFKLEGALLFDYGDGLWCGDVGSSLIYDRQEKIWRIWTPAFSHGHSLGYGETKNDPRYGINVMDMKLLPAADNYFDFGGVTGDEDPDLYYNSEDGLWYLTVCRLDKEAKRYRYCIFKSKKPNEDFEFVSHTDDTVETTGGSFVRFDGVTYFAFGRSFSEMSKYDVREFPSLKKLGELSCNHPDGGFRGWGSLFEIPCGTRKRLLWVTFDRTLGSDYNWSYGNIYVFESNTMKIKR